MSKTKELTMNITSPRVGAASTNRFNVGLWIIQILLALAFGLAGVMKLTQPIAELARNLGWPGVVPLALVRFIGAAEFAAAIGLVAAAATRIRPSLTPLAAVGLVLVMISAFLFHSVRGEMKALPLNLILGTMAAFVAWGRSKKVPISGR
ncbi:putative membrane protein YphA (DoxX/SURF4 family) [Haloferula luteola]|uniref:Putative membrane protein YphA (DoxX/SURF4 family) n=1 Tax=Haloferula luteola TaxID=595692 RepID=A0A840UYS4_9BACT|nr:DoxX family protein [Haloferula luteola]MBB5350932.1 putative membrane protein YphA (DoxX/SURF4 family) [Haloferula luteola]